MRYQSLQVQTLGDDARWRRSEIFLYFDVINIKLTSSAMLKLSWNFYPKSQMDCLHTRLKTLDKGISLSRTQIFGLVETRNFFIK
jgi:hypothetical protein